MPDTSVWSRRLGAVLACFSLYACATPQGPRAPGVTPAPRPEAPTPPIGREAQAPARRLADLPGWSDEDHAAAFRAFQAGCRAAQEPALADVCRRARSVTALDDAAAKAFFEDNFRVRRIDATGLLTGYYAPEYEAREDPVPPFTAPVRPRPADLPSGGAPYLDRATIETADPAPADALAWMKPEDLFFMQIQGSGVLDFPDGHKLKAIFAASNNLPFVAIATPLRQRGAIAAAGASAGSVHDWLVQHRGPDADAVMRLDPRYVFFTVAPEDGTEPAGAAGLPLVAGRAIAVDPAYHAMGGVYWVEADSPVLTGAVPAYHRLVMALDIGGAIKGPARADLYVGRGAAAGAEAGHIRHALTLYELAPVQ